MSAVLDQPIGTASCADAGSALSACRNGRWDPTTRLRSAGRGGGSCGELVRAALTSHGPATVHVRWRSGSVVQVVGAWGPGAEQLAARVPRMAGAEDPGAVELEGAAHAVVASAAAAHRHVRIGRTDDPYADLLPIVLAQRITAGEAVRQWAALCRLLGEPAPGPFDGLLLPPAPRVMARTPTWRLHRLGIERKRAGTLVEVARHADRLRTWTDLDPTEAAGRLGLLRGVGVWTVGNVLRTSWGDPDAVAVGDFHHKHTVSWALAGEPRGTDERMLELLEPYRGQRGRVVRLLGLHCGHAPAFGPKRRILPMREW